MQARIAWSPPSGVLGRLCQQAAERASLLQPQLASLQRLSAGVPSAPSLIEALGGGGFVHIIAEIKRSSPSNGDIDSTLNSGARAAAYADGGAAAISVLTEPDSFGGTNDDLAAVRAAVSVPVLKKDFHVDPAQVWEARALGASGILLIVRALGREGTTRMSQAARDAAIEALFEIRDEAELEWALEAGASLIGVNRRNLETLALDDTVPARLLPLIPPACIAVAESGINARAAVIKAAFDGADAVLVGTSLSRSKDAPEAVRALTGVTRVARRG